MIFFVVGTYLTALTILGFCALLSGGFFLVFMLYVVMIRILVWFIDKWEDD